MKKSPNHHRRLAISIAALSMLGLSQTALAGAYQLSREYNAVEIGNSGSGGAAIATDASTAFANPAGLTRIPNKQLVFSGDGIFTYAKFSGSNTWASTAFPFPPYTQTGTTKTNNRIFIPAFFYAMPLNMFGLPQNKWSFGFGASVPYGLSTDYPNSSILRYSATISKLSVVDISPDIAYKVNEQLSLGLGVDFDRVGVDFRRFVGNPDLSVALDSLSKNNASGWGYGGHLGILYQLDPKTRFGITYHSEVSATLTGSSSLTGPLVKLFGAPRNQISLDTFRTKFTLPPSTVFSAFHQFSGAYSAWATNASAYYTQWTAISGNQTSYNLAGLPPVTPTTALIPQHYRNTWLLALGGSYQFNSPWLVRAGVNYDQSPIKNAERNVTIPDSDRVGLSVGAHYDVNKYVSFDGGYMHLFFNDANVSIPLAVGAQVSTAKGSFNNSHVDIVGLQMNLNIV